MQSKDTKYRTGLLIFLLAGLCFPYVQSKFNIIKIASLKGAYATPPKNVSFNFSDWFEGSYQLGKEEYLKNSFGTRDYLIRIHNQFEYSLYHKVNAKDVIVGKNNYLFEEHYIQGYYGTDFAGIDSINNGMYRLQFINDTLKKLGKTLRIQYVVYP